VDNSLSKSDDKEQAAKDVASAPPEADLESQSSDSGSSSASVASAGTHHLSSGTGSPSSVGSSTSQLPTTTTTTLNVWPDGRKSIYLPPPTPPNLNDPGVAKCYWEYTEAVCGGLEILHRKQPPHASKELNSLRLIANLEFEYDETQLKGSLPIADLAIERKFTTWERVAPIIHSGGMAASIFSSVGYKAYDLLVSTAAATYKHLPRFLMPKSMLTTATVKSSWSMPSWATPAMEIQLNNKAFFESAYLQKELGVDAGIGEGRAAAALKFGLVGAAIGAFFYKDICKAVAGAISLLNQHILTKPVEVPMVYRVPPTDLRRVHKFKVTELVDSVTEERYDVLSYNKVLHPQNLMAWVRWTQRDQYGDRWVGTEDKYLLVPLELFFQLTAPRAMRHDPSEEDVYRTLINIAQNNQSVVISPKDTLLNDTNGHKHQPHVDAATLGYHFQRMLKWNSGKEFHFQPPQL